MLKDKRFWVGFLVGYAVLAFMPQLNVLSKMRAKGQ
jgi:hypothetical protein